MDKIYITGTGRCGTTFLIKIFSFLNLDTGYNKHNYKHFISSNCNSGMERLYNAPFHIIKNPNIMLNISHIVEDSDIKIKKIIIPVRKYIDSAKSRVYHQNKNGGLWLATDEKSQIRFYEQIMTNYIYTMIKYDIPTLFLDFDKMTTDKNYLFDQLRFLLDEHNISIEIFSKAYDEASDC